MDNFNLKKYLAEGILLEENKDYIDSILDKILDSGIESLTPEEKKYLDDKSQGTESLTPDEFIQDLFKSWKEGEIGAGNDIENIYDWEDLHKFDQDFKDGFLKYVDLVKKYPSLDKKDLALLNSIGHIKDFGGNSIYMPYSQHEWNSLDEKTYNKILSDNYGIEPQEDYDPDELSYEEEFGYSFEDKEELEKIKKHIKSIYTDFDKVKKESIKLFQKSTGRNPSKKLISIIFNDQDVKEYQNPLIDEQIKILKSLGFKGNDTNQTFIYNLPNNQHYWIVPETFYYGISDDYGKTIKKFNNFKEMIDYFKSHQ